MNSSDIIAITAIVISAIVSVTSAVISYKNNKANIQAKRSEIAFDKRLAAFSKIVGEIGKFTTLTGGVASQQFKTKEETIKYLNKYDGAKDFTTYYFEQRIFFPKKIDKEIREFIDLMTEYAEEIVFPLTQLDEKIEQTKATTWHVRLRNKEDEIVSVIQDFVGL